MGKFQECNRLSSIVRSMNLQLSSFVVENALVVFVPTRNTVLIYESRSIICGFEWNQ